METTFLASAWNAAVKSFSSRPENNLRNLQRGKIALALAFSLGVASPLFAVEPTIVEMKGTPAIELAQVLVVETVPNPVGVIVLLSGHNSSPAGLLNDPEWQELATRHRFALIGCYFKNNLKASNGFYQYPAEGSGKILTDAVRQIYKKDLPLALYGFSAGAQFTSRFAALYPRRVKAWAAYAPGSTDSLRPGAQLPPGILLCGEDDTQRHGPVKAHFDEGRAQGYRWVWVSVPKSGHTTTGPATSFIKSYFDSLLSTTSLPMGTWLNLDDGSISPNSTRKPTHGWLPDAKLVEAWKAASGK